MWPMSDDDVAKIRSPKRILTWKCHPFGWP